MINMDQVRTLEMKVKQTVQLIVQLRKENDALRGRLSDAEVRAQDLEAALEGYKATQSEMESGIRSALMELDHVGEVETSAGPVTATTQAEVEPEFEQQVAVEMVSEVELPPEPEIPAEDFSISENGEEWAIEPESEDSPDAPEQEVEPQQPGLGIF